jgi:tripartite-type tricarboxylate transporter receptor subunit TctC
MGIVGMRIVGVILAAAALSAGAQSYPTKPVRIIITFPPGSATDVVGRVVALKLTELWGQNVLTDNRGGAGGSIGTAIGARANPDGYTLIVNSNAHAINPSTYASLPYDTLKDFTDISPLVGTPNALVVHPNSKIRSVKELIADAKARPGKINFASAGIGSATHMNLEKFNLATGIDVAHIPYKGTAEVVTDMLGGRVDYYWAPVSAAISFIRENRLRALAVSSAKRSSQLPDLVTVAESGVPGFDFQLWFGLWGPAGIPPAIVAKIRTDVARALDSQDTRTRMAALAAENMDVKPADFPKFVRREIQDYAQIIKAAGIKPQ